MTFLIATPPRLRLHRVLVSCRKTSSRLSATGRSSFRFQPDVDNGAREIAANGAALQAFDFEQKAPVFAIRAAARG